MKYFGLICVILFFFWADGAYLSFRRKKLSETEALLRWVEKLRRSAESGNGLSAGKESDGGILEENGFLEKFRATEDVRFALTETAFSLNAEEMRPLLRLAEAVGQGSRSEETERLGRCADSLRQNAETCREKLTKDSRLLRTLTASLSAGVLILFL